MGTAGGSSRHPSGMVEVTQEDRFLFDLNGYLVIRGALTQTEVDSLNAAIDNHVDAARPRDHNSLKNTKSGSILSAAGSRLDLGGCLGWPGADGAAFHSLLAHPSLAPYLVALCGEGYRLDHQPLVLLQDSQSEGFSLHGGPLCLSKDAPDGRFNPELQYRYDHGTLWSSLLAMSVCLAPVAHGDG